MEKVVHVKKDSLKEDLKVKETLDVTPLTTPVNIDDMPNKKAIITPKSSLVAFIVIVLLGVGTGYVAAKGVPGGNKATQSQVAITPATDGVKEAGIADTSALENITEAEGVLKEGGIDGEGTHYLDRGLGKEKYVYLLSSAINLQSFVDKKVLVQGQTVSAKKAGWLMDVVKVKVLE